MTKAHHLEMDKILPKASPADTAECLRATLEADARRGLRANQTMLWRGGPGVLQIHCATQRTNRTLHAPAAAACCQPESKSS